MRYSELIICSDCGKKVMENGYCEVDDSPYGECCWTDHVYSCKKCEELNT